MPNSLRTKIIVERENGRAMLIKRVKAIFSVEVFSWVGRRTTNIKRVYKTKKESICSFKKLKETKGKVTDGKKARVVKSLLFITFVAFKNSYTPIKLIKATAKFSRNVS